MSKSIASSAKNTMNLPADKGINRPNEQLVSKQCRDYSSKEKSLDEPTIKTLIKQTPSWHFSSKKNVIVRTFHFRNYYQTIDFVNHLADICHQQDHHPELKVSYRECRVAFNTHSVNGVTENDFICAAKIDIIILGKLEKSNQGCQ